MVLKIYENPYKPVDQFNGWSWCFPAGFWSGHWRPGWDRCARAFARIFHSAGGGEGGTAETQGGHGPEGLHGLPLLAGWCLGMGLMFFLVEFLWCPFFCSVQEEHVFQSVRSDQTVFFQNSLKEALRIAHLACRKRLSETKTTSWLVSWRQRTSETIPLFDSVHLQISPKLCILNFHDVPALWSNMIHGPIWSLWSWCTELAAWWRLRQVVASDWQEANLRTKIKSIISESKAAIVDEDEEEASIAWRFRLQSASFHAPKGCCHGEHRNNTSNSLVSSSLGFERLRPIHIWLQVHTFDISAFTKIKYVYSKGEWRENTTIFQSHGFLLIFHSTNPFQPPASINLPYCRMSQTKRLESRSWSLRCHPRGPATLKV